MTQAEEGSPTSTQGSQSPMATKSPALSIAGINIWLGSASILCMVAYGALVWQGQSMAEYRPFVRPLVVLFLALDHLLFAARDVRSKALTVEECSTECSASSNLQKRGRAALLIGFGLIVAGGADLLLELTATGNGNYTFIAHSVSFLANCMYALAFLQRDSRTGLGTYPPCLVFGLAAFFYIRPGLPTLMRFPVGLYILSLVGMLWRACIPFLSSPPMYQMGNTNSKDIGPVELVFEFGATRGFLGAALICIADAILAVNKYRTFLIGAETYALFTHWVGQILVASSAYIIEKKTE